MVHSWSGNTRACKKCGRRRVERMGLANHRLCFRHCMFGLFGFDTDSCQHTVVGNFTNNSIQFSSCTRWLTAELCLWLSQVDACEWGVAPQPRHCCLDLLCCPVSQINTQYKSWLIDRTWHYIVMMSNISAYSTVYLQPECEQCCWCSLIIHSVLVWAAGVSLYHLNHLRCHGMLSASTPL